MCCVAERKEGSPPSTNAVHLGKHHDSQCPLCHGGKLVVDRLLCAAGAYHGAVQYKSLETSYDWGSACMYILQG